MERAPPTTATRSPTAARSSTAPRPGTAYSRLGWTASRTSVEVWRCGSVEDKAVLLPHFHTSTLRIDLRTLELAAEVNVDAFPFGEDVQDVAAFAVAVAGLADSAEGEMDFRADCGGVDVDDSGLHVAHRPKRPVHIGCVDGAAQSELDSVYDGNRVVHAVARNHAGRGSEDLLLGDAHL